ncbi:metallopeptidase family protein [Nakamurella aerolata]|uniref:Metallopeptidase family protein n=1 Tax=Nakamurella aerolata TaxID=1656892 RepID=A0A849AAV5_9ACTN|nr:metallopeptidase family protein [Nakamurella aerolata]
MSEPGQQPNAARPRPTQARPSRARPGRHGRDRHGRGLRGTLLSSEVPAGKSRAAQFDAAVLVAVSEVEGLWGERVAAIEFAVDEVPPLPRGAVAPSADVVLDGAVPLARFVPPGVDRRGRATKARVVVYRRPVESRAVDSAELAELVTEILTEQLNAVLGEPDEPA